jgi:hypothetical protein
MRTCRWLTLGAAIIVTALEVWLLTSTSALAASLPLAATSTKAPTGSTTAVRTDNRADATRHIDVVLNGLQGARASGVTYANPMPAFGATLSDAAIAAIVDYERSAWGNHGALISSAQVASERARWK